MSETAVGVNPSPSVTNGEQERRQLWHHFGQSFGHFTSCSRRRKNQDAHFVPVWPLPRSTFSFKQTEWRKRIFRYVIYNERRRAIKRWNPLYNKWNELRFFSLLNFLSEHLPTFFFVCFVTTSWAHLPSQRRTRISKVLPSGKINNSTSLISYSLPTS